MALKYQPTKHAFLTEGVSLTEQEHKDSCDINKMIHAASRGQQIRGGHQPQFGYDDTTMDGLQYRIQKQKLEEQLSSSEKELDQSVFERIPQTIREKFGFKQKAQKNDETKTTNITPQNEAQNQPLPTPNGDNQSPKNDPSKAQ